MTDESRSDLDQAIRLGAHIEHVASEILLRESQICPHCGEELAGVDYLITHEQGATQMVCVCGEVVDEWEEE